MAEIRAEDANQKASEKHISMAANRGRAGDRARRPDVPNGDCGRRVHRGH